MTSRGPAGKDDAELALERPAPAQGDHAAADVGVDAHADRRETMLMPTGGGGLDDRVRRLASGPRAAARTS